VSVQRIGVELGRLREVSLRDLGIRFAAGAATSLGAALIGTFVGSRPSGPFLAFPAIYMAGLTLIERKEGEEEATATARGAVVGALALAAFAIVVDFLTGRIAWPLALLAGLGVWFAVAFGVYAAVRPLIR
jgi:hypothetical protein